MPKFVSSFCLLHLVFFVLLKPDTQNDAEIKIEISLLNILYYSRSVFGIMDQGWIPNWSFVKSTSVLEYCTIAQNKQNQIKLFFIKRSFSVSGEVHALLSSLSFWGPEPSVPGTDGRGMCLYVFRGQAHPTQQGVCLSSVADLHLHRLAMFKDTMLRCFYCFKLAMMCWKWRLNMGPVGL